MSSSTRDLGEVLALADHHHPLDRLAAGQELGLADDRRAAAAGLAALAAALLLGLEPGGAGDRGDLVLGVARLADPGDGVLRVVGAPVVAAAAAPAAAPRGTLALAVVVGVAPALLVRALLVGLLVGPLVRRLGVVTGLVLLVVLRAALAAPAVVLLAGLPVRLLVLLAGALLLGGVLARALTGLAAASATAAATATATTVAALGVAVGLVGVGVGVVALARLVAGHRGVVGVRVGGVGARRDGLVRLLGLLDLVHLGNGDGRGALAAAPGRGGDLRRGRRLDRGLGERRPARRRSPPRPARSARPRRGAGVVTLRVRRRGVWVTTGAWKTTAAPLGAASVTAGAASVATTGASAAGASGATAGVSPSAAGAGSGEAVFFAAVLRVVVRLAGARFVAFLAGAAVGPRSRHRARPTSPKPRRPEPGSP